MIQRILTLIFYWTVIASAQQTEPVYLFALLHQLGERDNVFFTLESGTGAGFSFPRLNNAVENVTIVTLKGMDLSSALMKLFPNYILETEDTDRGRIIHLIDKHLTRPYILDRKVSVIFKGTYCDLLNSLDKDNKVTIQTMFPANDAVWSCRAERVFQVGDEVCSDGESFRRESGGILLPKGAGCIGLKPGDRITGADGVEAETLTLHQFGQMLEKIGTHRLQVEGSDGIPRDLTLKITEPGEVKP